MTILGTDVSSNNGTIDFSQYNRPFIIIKCTEGTDYVNPNWATQVSQARSKHLGIGHYHYARPDAGNSAEDEATYFTDNCTNVNTGELVCLDFEVSYANPVDWCVTWLEVVSAIYDGKVSPFIYLNQSLVSGNDWSPAVSGHYPLWLARYDNNTTDFSSGSGQWGSYVLKQYTDTASVPGISGNVDGDAFDGNINSFYSYGYNPPPPPPVWQQIPVPPHSTGERILDIRNFADYPAVGHPPVSHTEGLTVMPHEPYHSAPIYEEKISHLPHAS